MESKLSIQERNNFYTKTLQEIIDCKYEIFMCLSLKSKSKCDIKEFTELTLFYSKKFEDTAWIHEQLNLDGGIDALDYDKKLKIANEYRVFILSLCIEMTK